MYFDIENQPHLKAIFQSKNEWKNAITEFSVERWIDLTEIINAGKNDIVDCNVSIIRNTVSNNDSGRT